MNLNCLYECKLVSDWYVTCLNTRHASLYENVETNILLCAVFKYSLCVTILKFPDTCTALCGTLLPHMRHYAKINNYFHTVIQCYLYVTIRKIAGDMRQHAVFHIILYTALYHCCNVNMRFYAEKEKRIYVIVRISRVFAVVVEYLFLLVM